MATAEKKPFADLSPTQKHHLARAVKRAYDAGWKGRGPDEDHAPKLFGSSWASTGVPLGTRQALAVRGYARRQDPPKANAWALTRKGVAAGEAAYKEQAGRSAAAATEEQTDIKAREAAANRARRKKLAEPFRGLKVPDHSDVAGKATLSLQKVIEEAPGGGIELSEGALEMIGQGIERLRSKSKRKAGA